MMDSVDKAWVFTCKAINYNMQPNNRTIEYGFVAWVFQYDARSEMQYLFHNTLIYSYNCFTRENPGYNKLIFCYVFYC